MAQRFCLATSQLLLGAGIGLAMAGTIGIINQEYKVSPLALGLFSPVVMASAAIPLSYANRR